MKQTSGTALVDGLIKRINSGAGPEPELDAPEVLRSGEDAIRRQPTEALSVVRLFSGC